MALTGKFTINGATAGAVFHDSGAINLSPFTSYSAYLSDQFSFGKSSYTEIDSAKLVLKSPFGKLVATDHDTISAAYGGDTIISGSVNFSFVSDGVSTPLPYGGSFSDTIPGGASLGNASLGGAASVLSAFEHDLKPTAVSLLPAASASTVADVAAVMAPKSIELGHGASVLLATLKPTDKA